MKDKFLKLSIWCFIKGITNGKEGKFVGDIELRLSMGYDVREDVPDFVKRDLPECKSRGYGSHCKLLGIHVGIFKKK